MEVEARPQNLAKGRRVQEIQLGHQFAHSLEIFLPFIEEASKEDDEELSDWWARLLSSSADTTVGFDLVCVDILKSMGRTEAEFLLRMSKYRFPEWDELEWDISEIRSKLQEYDGDPVPPDITNIIEAAETTLSTAKLVEFLEEHVRIFVIRTYYKGIPDWDRGQFSESDRRSFEALRRLGLLDVEAYYSDERNYLEYVNVTTLGREFLARVVTLI